MSLAVENFKFLMRNIPDIIMYSSGIGALETMRRLDDPIVSTNPHLSIWAKAKPGAYTTLIFLIAYSAISTVEQVISKSKKYSTLLLYTNSVFSVISMIWLCPQICRDLFKSSDDGWQDRIKNCLHNTGAVMVSVLVGTVGIVIVKTISKTCIGQNFNESCSRFLD